MAYAGGKEIENSFNLEIFNISPDKTEIDLFGLGITDTSLLTNKSPMSSNYRNIGIPELNVYFDVNGAGGGAAQPNSNKDVLVDVVGGGGGVEITLTNNETPAVSVTTAIVTELSSLTDVIDVINTTLSTTAGFEGIYLGMLFDYSRYVAPASATNFPLQLYVIYSPVATTELASLNFVNPIPPQAPVLIEPYKTADLVPCWANNYGVIITPRNGISYGEILESQNGQVLDIKSMSFIITSMSTAFSVSQQEQIYNCFNFQKTDMNGNKIEYKKCPVVDVYSNPSINSIDDLQLERKADVYTLDGTTNLTYELNSGIVVQLGSEFTRLTNLLQESKKGQEQIEVEKREIAKNRLNTGYALDKVAVTEESQKNQKGFNFSGDESKKKAPLQYYATPSLYLEELPHYY